MPRFFGLRRTLGGLGAGCPCNPRVRVRREDGPESIDVETISDSEPAVANAEPPRRDSEPAVANAEPPRLASLDLKQASTPLVQLAAQGKVDNTEYAAALTCGDGACALHSMFGAISARKELFLESARNRVQDMLPLTWDDLRVRVSTGMSHMWDKEVQAIRLMLWNEYASKYAEAVTLGLESPSAEATAFWNHLDENVQMEIQAFAEAKAAENADAREAAQALGDVARCFFVEANEASLV